MHREIFIDSAILSPFRMKFHLYAIHVKARRERLSSEEREEEDALRFKLLWESISDFGNFEDADEHSLSMQPPFWSHKALERALEDFDDPYAMLAVANGLVSVTEALDYDWASTGKETLRALFKHTAPFQPARRKEALWSAQDLLSHLKKLGPDPSPYAMRLAASKHLSLKAIAAYKKWHTPTERPFYSLMMTFARPEGEALGSLWRASELFAALRDKENIMLMSCIARKFIPVVGAEDHPWERVGVKTYQQLKFREDYDSVLGKGAYWKEIKGLDNSYRMEAIRCYHFDRALTEGYAWKSCGEALLEALRRFSERHAPMKEALASLKEIESPSLMRILSTGLLHQKQIETLQKAYPSLQEIHYQAMEHVLPPYHEHARYEAAEKIATLSCLEKVHAVAEGLMTLASETSGDWGAHAGLILSGLRAVRPPKRRRSFGAATKGHGSAADAIDCSLAASSSSQESQVDEYQTKRPQP